MAHVDLTHPQSLARAIAARPKLLILDDAFSAIDRSTKRIIFDRLFGPKGIANEHGITVIQVTQDSEYIGLYTDALLMRTSYCRAYGTVRRCDL